MSQLIYAFAAVAIAALLSFQFFAGSTAVRSNMQKHEILTQVGGLATEVIEEIGRRAFDHRTRDDLFAAPLASAADLTPPSDFGGVSVEDCESLCLDIDDYHGLTLERKRGGFDFKVSIFVRYVDPEYPERGLRVQTFAKEVFLRITNPNIHHADRPDVLMPIKVGRVFTYLQTS